MTETKSNKGLAWLANLYLIVFSIAGICLTTYIIRNYFIYDFSQALRPAGSIYREILHIIVLTIALSLCRSLSLPTRKGQGIDISMVIIYASMILKGLEATVLIIVLSAFFTIVKWDNKNRSHIFNTPILKTLFNNSNHVISVSLGSLAFSIPAINTGNLDLLTIFLPSIIFFIVTIIVNSINLFTILKLTTEIPYFSSLFSGIVGMLPTLLAFAPIGYFLAIVFNFGDNGPFLALLFFVPLLFARYAFKLYIDSKEQYLRTISTLTTAIEAKDEYTEGHSKRVAQYAVDIAHTMGLTNARIENIKVAAVLHDIGKIGIDDEILRKPSKLNEEEWGKIMQHPAIGIKILEEVVMPEAVKEMIHYHHVRYDRGGYPKISRDQQIPMEVHIISLADAYDAMTSDRPYRKALTDEAAFEIIEQERGTQFHPDVVDVFLKMRKVK